MNSEELELSLRSEFEQYLKTFRAELKQEADELQRRLTEAFEAYAARFDSEQPFDEAFTSTVTEHLRLARDEGAKLTATALAEAEQLEGNDKAAADYSSIRDAVADISAQTSQSAILTSLVTHAAQFAPRGAFFIIKSEHFAGWKLFGEAGGDEDAVRQVHFPVSDDTILSRSVDSMSTIDSAYGAHRDDQKFLEPLEFGHPDRMYAVPLVARGRGVAVLYADHGAADSKINIEALETLVRIAALTVELLAASHQAHAEGRHQEADFETAQHEVAPAPEPAAEAYHEPVQEYAVESEAQRPAEEYEPQATDFAFSESGAPEEAFESAPAYSEEPAAEEEAPADEFTAHEEQPESEFFEAEPEVVEHEEAAMFEAPPSIEPEPTPFQAPEPEPPPFQAPAQPEPAIVTGGFAPERSIDVSPHSPTRTRLSDRNVDLPIDVAEEERRLHNDARRFARLLVSEIKLYNEKKVLEGRQANDLYERLREAIDRSREMYDKRVQPPVAAKFDYFHYELVNALADGNPERLGTNYPGANI